MIFVDFQHEDRPVVRCLFGAGPFPEACFSYRSEIAPKTQLPRPDGRLGSVVGGGEVGKDEGVHIVHTLGFRSGRTGAGLGRLRRFSGKCRIFKCWNPVRVPPRAQCFPCSGAFFGVSTCGQCPHSCL